MWNLKTNDTCELIYKTETDSERTTYGYQCRTTGGKGSQGIWNGHVHIAIIKTDNQQGPAVWHRNSAKCYVTVWRGGESEEDGHVYMYD